MKLFNKLANIFLFTSTLAVVSTYGTTFDYSYTFSNGGLVVGSFEGTQNGNLITGISNASVFINGNSIDTGFGIFAVTRNTNGQFVNGFAQVSIDGLENNFIFANGDIVSGSAYSGHFMSKSNGAGNPSLMQGGDNSHAFYAFDLVVLSPRNWNVSLRSAQAVPETTITLALLSSCMLGLAAFRRRFAA